VSPLAFIEFRHVQKAFGPKEVYKDLSLDVRRGETLTVIGGSGVGKSVMLKMLIGLLSVDAGSIRFDGEEVANLRERQMLRVRRRIAMLFQGAALFDSVNVKENVAYGLREQLQMTEKQIDERVRESLGYVGLDGIQDMWPASLSGGMKKRVGLARAIAVQPEVLLYDEPTTGLDPINTDRINKLILHLKDTLSVTSIVVTHDMSSAFKISDRLAMVYEGRVIFQGTVDEIRAETDPRVHSFITGEAPDDETLEGLLGA